MAAIADSELDGLPEGSPAVGGLPGTGNRAFWAGLAIVVAAIVSSLATFLIITGLTPIQPRDVIIYGLFLLNILLIGAMVALLGWQVAGLRRAWRDKTAGARLHVRIVLLFTSIAALPALLLAVAATTTFARALDNAFNVRTRQIVENSLDVARAYLEEHGQIIRTDIVNMGKDLDDASDTVKGDVRQSNEMRELLAAHAGLRDLSLALVVDGEGREVVRFAADTRIKYEPPPDEAMKVAGAGHVPLLMPTERHIRVAAITRLNRYPGYFLYGARSVNPRVFGHLQRTRAGVAEYQVLRQARGVHKFLHGLMYSTISLTAVLAAIWVGMWFAGRLVEPIRRLIAAAQRVAKGDLSVVLPLHRGEGDLRRLSKDFNHMTREIDRQRSALEERRRFTEAVLSGVSAGVVGVDAAGRITIANSSAEKLLGHESVALVGEPLAAIVPGIAALLEPSETGRVRPPDPIRMTVDGKERTVAVQITREQAGTSTGGAVVTFDDITELVTAQRSSAWADVARRIAHEIKNPLTPIQLSAERLKRKYGAKINDDRETFDKLTDTIVRQVGDIKTMVDEFAAFARMPKPTVAPHDLRESVQEPVIQYRETHPAIEYVLALPSAPVVVDVDGRLIAQALTNLVKNATEAVRSAAEAADADPGYRGQVEVRLKSEDKRILIEVLDNGVGLPKQDRERLVEPYITTKGAKGTGLGLAIVQKITEHHGGTLSLEDAPPGPRRKRGALVRITLPAGSAARTTADAGDRQPASADAHSA